MVLFAFYTKYNFLHNIFFDYFSETNNVYNIVYNKINAIYINFFW